MKGNDGAVQGRVTGKVYLVGAGPGDTGLITVRGRELIAQADVILYDYLANTALLCDARPGAERIYVGKRSGRKRFSQEEISSMLIRKAKRGRVVVRLKGGDPWLFGRGVEEVLALSAEGIPFEIIPGVTSALAVPAAAHVPLTIRGYSSSVTILTGHEAKEPDTASGRKQNPNPKTQIPKPKSQNPTDTIINTCNFSANCKEIAAEAFHRKGVDWERLLKADSTFVVLMGVAKIEEIVARFLESGKEAQMPAAVIERGTTGAQRVISGPLSGIVSLVNAIGIRPPALLVVGDAAGLAKTISPPARRSLQGVKVLVTRPWEQASNLAGLLERRGAIPLIAPLITIEPLKDYTELERAFGELAGYEWVVFTSANGVRQVMEAIASWGSDARLFAPVRICAIGPATAKELACHGLRVDCVPEEYRSQGVVESLDKQGEIAGKRFLLFRSSIAGTWLVDELTRRGGECRDVVAYRTVPVKELQDDVAGSIRAHGVDVVVLTSPSVVEAYCAALRPLMEEMGKNPLLAVIGPVTGHSAVECGLEVGVCAERYTDEGIVESLAAHYRRAQQP